MYDEYFGKADAEQESLGHLTDYFFSKKSFEELKTDNLDSGKCVVVGVKGSGKTHICKWLQQDYKDSRIGWKFEISDGISVLQIPGKSHSDSGTCRTVKRRKSLATIL
jgi:hypothetical protein